METKKLLENKPITIGLLISLVGFIGPISAALLFIDTRYAHASDLQEAQIQLKRTIITFDKVSTDIQADIVEQRLERELEKENPDAIKVDKLKRRLMKFDARSEELEKILIDVEGPS